LNFKSPEDDLEEFLAKQPSWLRKILQFDGSLSLDEHQAWVDSNWWQEGGKSDDEYMRLLQRVPTKLREYRKRREQAALIALPSVRPGRPRKDALAEAAAQLHQAGKSHPEIAVLLRDKFTIMTKKGLREPTPEGIRKLLESRKPRSTPDKA